ncbi:nucleic acid-binding protein [Cylindrospermopsis raciborskii CENA303]|uniref:Nucleic acid-binding protein n=1 Tax=Cylindrospermopsis raciborskii CENA303 TaxID=1170769 RepID=A0A1X4G3S7_9CYAN|nr:PIN domain-containing protein [Cylindrospermopsis raciborskii]OSO89159.1 nucleic acid-binding protein [Cylindrospermopsis raciborskii CENA303]
MLIDSNLIIYATQPPYTQLRSWLVNYATHYSAISRLETLGYHRLGDAEKQAIMAILDNLDVLMINKVTLEIAVALRQQQKMSVGDSLIAATCLDSDLLSGEGQNFNAVVGNMSTSQSDLIISQPPPNLQ